VKPHAFLNAYISTFKYYTENNWKEDECARRICPWIYSCAKNNKPSMNPIYWEMWWLKVIF